MKAARGAGGEDGFTLLEILVALIVLAMLMAGLAQGTQFGIRAWNNQAAAVGRNGDLDTADRTLRTLLTRMQPPSAADQPSLRGQAGAMQFISELPLGAPASPTRLAAIELVANDGRLLLRWTVQPHAKALGPVPAAHADVLLQGVKALDLSYRSRAGAWSTSWTLPSLPQLIRIHIVFAAGSARQWPDILVAPMRDSISETGE